MFQLIEPLKNSTISQTKCFELGDLQNGINLFEDFIIFKKNNEIKIIDRNCDHAGGKLISKNSSKLICPIHNWELNLNTLKYENGINKETIPYKKKGSKFYFKIKRKVPMFNDKILSKDINNSKFIKIKFLNHSCLIFENESFKFATDPWLIGPAFLNGWWLKYETNYDWVEELNSCDFIYISHNHPDHLHPFTLSKIDKNLEIIVPKFLSDSTGLLVEEVGFKKVTRLDFNKQYQFKKTSLMISLLKSGDFREDSGIFFKFKDFKCLLDVDSNIINFGNLPKVDLYCSSFAAGASGYPLMFDNYKLEEKIKKINIEKNFWKHKKIQFLKKIKPKYFLPYAGFFEEKLKRDSFVKKHNLKNSISDYKNVCNNLKIELLDVTKNNNIILNEKKILKMTNVLGKNKKNNIITNIDYVNFIKEKFNNFDEKYIKQYFLKSKFRDNLILYISLASDDFDKIYYNFSVNFSTKTPEFKILNFDIDFSKLDKNDKLRTLYLNIRKESFLNTIYSKLPWEDLVIGFQCKILRSPNIYNVNFWHHFTNKYVTSKRIRIESKKCYTCSFINQQFDDQIFNQRI